MENKSQSSTNEPINSDPPFKCPSLGGRDTGEALDRWRVRQLRAVIMTLLLIEVTVIIAALAIDKTPNQAKENQGIEIIPLGEGAHSTLPRKPSRLRVRECP
jgi:hypothetical protein